MLGPPNLWSFPPWSWMEEYSSIQDFLTGHTWEAHRKRFVKIQFVYQLQPFLGQGAATHTFSTCGGIIAMYSKWNCLWKLQLVHNASAWTIWSRLLLFLFLLLFYSALFAFVSDVLDSFFHPIWLLLLFKLQLPQVVWSWTASKCNKIECFIHTHIYTLLIATKRLYMSAKGYKCD